MKIIMVLATGKNGEIGANGGLPWDRIPEDMKHFQDLTMGKHIVMGRNTFLSMGSKLLTGRYSSVITSDRRIKSRVDGLGGYTPTAHEIIMCKDMSWPFDAYIIGGAQLYKAFLPYVDEIYHTHINNDFPNADTFIDMDFNEGFTLVPEESKVLCGGVEMYKFVRDVK